MQHLDKQHNDQHYYDIMIMILCPMDIVLLYDRHHALSAAPIWSSPWPAIRRSSSCSPIFILRLIFVFQWKAKSLTIKLFRSDHSAEFRGMSQLSSSGELHELYTQWEKYKIMWGEQFSVNGSSAGNEHKNLKSS